MDTFSNRLTKLLGIRYPIIQGGMVWHSGWRLAAAVSNAGGLGLIGSGSMYPEVLREHIRSCKKVVAGNTFGVNIPLLYPQIAAHIQIILEEKVPVVFTSAGNPATWTKHLKENGVTVVHVVSSTKFALKAEAAGVDAVVAEGFEAGGHNGREETTSLVLWPSVAAAVKVPVIAAGGIATGRQILAAMVLGAEGVQLGTLFAASEEASSHINFKNALLEAQEGDTRLSLKKLVPVRLLKNRFYEQVQAAEDDGLNADGLRTMLGKGRAKKGMFEGDLDEGELEIGQVVSMIQSIRPAGKIVETLWSEFWEAKNRLKG